MESVLIAASETNIDLPIDNMPASPTILKQSVSGISWWTETSTSFNQDSRNKTSCDLLYVRTYKMHKNS